MTERTDHIEIPDRYRYAVIPHIMVDDAAAAIDFYQRAFGAREDFRIDAPGGGILHAEITIGRSALMLGDASVDEAEAASFAAPTALGGYVRHAARLRAGRRQPGGARRSRRCRDPPAPEGHVPR